MDETDIAVDELRTLIERVERVDEEIAGMKDDRKDIFAEAKGRGYDTKTIRAILALRKVEKDKRDESEALRDLYKQVLGL